MANMTAEAIQARREYQKQWRAKNKDKIREKNAAYWQRKAEAAQRRKAEESGGAGV